MAIVKITLSTGAIVECPVGTKMEVRGPNGELVGSVSAEHVEVGQQLVSRQLCPRFCPVEVALVEVI